MAIDIYSLERLFEDYVESFTSTDEDINEHIRLKRIHTQKVRSHCVALSHDLGMTAAQCRLAEAVGLFHDFGRFSQYRTYHTFNDFISVNHAFQGLREMSRLGIRRLFEKADWETLYFAIKYHNALAVPQEAPAEWLMMAKLIRDADKLDIYRVLAPGLKPAGARGCSAAMVDDILAERQSGFGSMKTPDDRKLIRLCWLYDINYNWTLRQIVEAGYIGQLFAFLPQDEAMDCVRKTLAAYVDRRLHADIAETTGK